MVNQRKHIERHLLEELAEAIDEAESANEILLVRRLNRIKNSTWGNDQRSGQARWRF